MEEQASSREEFLKHSFPLLSLSLSHSSSLLLSLLLCLSPSHVHMQADMLNGVSLVECLKIMRQIVLSLLAVFKFLSFQITFLILKHYLKLMSNSCSSKKCKLCNSKNNKKSRKKPLLKKYFFQSPIFQ